MPPISVNSGVNEQLERLKRVQEEIDRKNMEERNETDKIVKDIMAVSRRYNMGSAGSSPRFGQRKYSDVADPYNLNMNAQTSSGNMRHESQFQRLENNAVRMQDMMQGPNVEQNRKFDEDLKLGGGGSSFEVHGPRDSRDEMAKLDSLIDDFQRGNNRE